MRPPSSQERRGPSWRRSHEGRGLTGWTAIVSALLIQMRGTPYVLGGMSPAGVDCSGIVSAVANIATGRPAFGDRFSTMNESQELAARGFIPGSQPGDLNVGFNSHHTALTLPDGTAVESGGRSGGGVEVNTGAGAFDPQFTMHMHLPGSGDDAVPAVSSDGPGTTGTPDA